jgi:hypothetical protein
MSVGQYVAAIDKQFNDVIDIQGLEVSQPGQFSEKPTIRFLLFE